MTSKIYPTSFGLDVSVAIVRELESNTAFVDVIAPHYVNKKWRMGHSYNARHYTDQKILKDPDFIRVMFAHYPSDA